MSTNIRKVKYVKFRVSTKTKKRSEIINNVVFNARSVFGWTTIVNKSNHRKILIGALFKSFKCCANGKPKKIVLKIRNLSVILTVSRQTDSLFK